MNHFSLGLNMGVNSVHCIRLIDPTLSQFDKKLIINNCVITKHNAGDLHEKGREPRIVDVLGQILKQ